MSPLIQLYWSCDCLLTCKCKNPKVAILCCPEEGLAEIHRHVFTDVVIELPWFMKCFLTHYTLGALRQTQQWKKLKNKKSRRATELTIKWNTKISPTKCEWWAFWYSVFICSPPAINTCRYNTRRACAEPSAALHFFPDIIIIITGWTEHPLPQGASFCLLFLLLFFFSPPPPPRCVFKTARREQKP